MVLKLGSSSSLSQETGSVLQPHSSPGVPGDWRLGGQDLEFALLGWSGVGDFQTYRA